VPRVAPARRRSTQNSIPGGISIVIPPRRRLLLTLFLCAWLVGWAIGEVAAARELLLGRAPPFLIVWLAAWTAGGSLVIAIVAWGLGGHEIVSIGATGLTVRREAFGIGRTWEYDPAQIRHMRVAPAPFDPFDLRSSFRLWGIGGGTIAFDYGARTYRLGAGVDEAEAAAIVEALRERLPAGA
jgi:hypothetical protein